jgi:poly-gamma-glutamate synthesis protein (capsule biosynthesis protein)
VDPYVARRPDAWWSPQIFAIVLAGALTAALSQPATNAEPLAAAVVEPLAMVEATAAPVAVTEEWPVDALTDEMTPIDPDPSLVAAIEARPEPRGRLVINGVGDVNFDPGYIPAFTVEGYEHGFGGLDGLFLEDDLTVINLECPASFLGRPQPKQFTFQCDPAALPIMRAQGVEVASQGNNHSLDFGADALVDSIANLEAAGIAAVGAGDNAADAAKPALFEVNGWTVAVVGFGGVVPAGFWIATEDRPGMADGDTVETMVAAVEAADAVADVVVVTIHWGVELQSGPPADDVVRAQAMIDAGADMIFGHHPHRLNALEFYNGRPIAWSLGNFVWPRLSAAGSDTAVAQVIVEPDGSVRACFLDVTIVSHGRPLLDDPTVRTCPDPALPLEPSADEP